MILLFSYIISDQNKKFSENKRSGPNNYYIWKNRAKYSVFYYFKKISELPLG